MKILLVVLLHLLVSLGASEDPVEDCMITIAEKVKEKDKCGGICDHSCGQSECFCYYGYDLDHDDKKSCQNKCINNNEVWTDNGCVNRPDLSSEDWKVHDTSEVIDNLNIIKKYLEFIERLPSIDLKLNTKIRQNQMDHMETAKNTAVYWSSEVYPSIRQSFQNQKSMSEKFLTEANNIEEDLESIISSELIEIIEKETRKHCEDCSEKSSRSARRCVRDASMKVTKLRESLTYRGGLKKMEDTLGYINSYRSVYTKKGNETLEHIGSIREKMTVDRANFEADMVELEDYLVFMGDHKKRVEQEIGNMTEERDWLKDRNSKRDKDEFAELLEDVSKLEPDNSTSTSDVYITTYVQPLINRGIRFVGDVLNRTEAVSGDEVAEIVYISNNIASGVLETIKKIAIEVEKQEDLSAVQEQYMDALRAILGQQQKETEKMEKLSKEILQKDEKLRGTVEETKRIEEMIQKKRDATTLVAYAIPNTESAADNLVLSTMQWQRGESQIDHAWLRARTARKEDEEEELKSLNDWLTKERKKWQDVKSATIEMMQKL